MSHVILVGQTDKKDFSYVIDEGDKVLAIAIIDLLNVEDKLK